MGTVREVVLSGCFLSLLVTSGHEGYTTESVEDVCMLHYSLERSIYMIIVQRMLRIRDETDRSVGLREKGPITVHLLPSQELRYLYFWAMILACADLSWVKINRSGRQTTPTYSTRQPLCPLALTDTNDGEEGGDKENAFWWMSTPNHKCNHFINNALSSFGHKFVQICVSELLHFRDNPSTWQLWHTNTRIKQHSQCAGVPLKLHPKVSSSISKPP